jgi:hypothetical protein
MLPRIALAVMAGLAMSVATVSLSIAQSAREVREGRVSVCSFYGNGCASASIRPVANDYEFRMPSGTWVRCRADCKAALREEVLDFWETLRERSGDRSR